MVKRGRFREFGAIYDVGWMTRSEDVRIPHHLKLIKDSEIQRGHISPNVAI